MSSPDLLDRGAALLCVIDIQERLAAAMGYGEIRLYTNARFVENVALYQRLGYAMTREEPFLGGRVTHMSKTLGAA